MTNLKIHILMHVAYEGPGCIENWILENGHEVSYTKFYKDYSLPQTDNIDALIVMGGPMSVYEENNYNWLTEEKAFIREAINKGKKVIGICLGSQLIAEVLGARVYPNKQKEIGWFEIYQTQSATNSSVLKGTSQQLTVFHWHGDTYDLPDQTEHLYYSNTCKNQAFIYKNHVLGLQFHFEVTQASLNAMVENGASELQKGETIQTAEEITENKYHYKSNNNELFEILNNFFSQS